jgi:hypothetical protein
LRNQPWRVLSSNSPTGCSVEKQPVTRDDLRARDDNQHESDKSDDDAEKKMFLQTVRVQDT